MKKRERRHFFEDSAVSSAIRSLIPIFTKNWALRVSAFLTLPVARRYASDLDRPDATPWQKSSSLAFDNIGIAGLPLLAAFARRFGNGDFSDCGFTGGLGYDCGFLDHAPPIGRVASDDKRTPQGP